MNTFNSTIFADQSAIFGHSYRLLAQVSILAEAIIAHMHGRKIFLNSGSYTRKSGMSEKKCRSGQEAGRRVLKIARVFLDLPLLQVLDPVT